MKVYFIESDPNVAETGNKVFVLPSKVAINNLEEIYVREQHNIKFGMVICGV